MAPATGPEAGGTVVTLTGTGFTDATRVAFGSTAATAFTVDGSTRITATAPAGTGGVDVVVTGPGGSSPTSPSARYTYVPLPVVTAVTPPDGPTAGGGTVAIAGSGFDGATAVTFGAAPATAFTVVSAESITATVPAGASGRVHVRVTTPGGVSALSDGDRYTYADPTRDPKVTAVFEDETLSAGVSTTLAYSLFNPNTRASFGRLEARFTLPDGLVGSNVASSCADAVSIVGQVVTVNLARLAPRTTCTITLTVTATREGSFDAGSVSLKSDSGEASPTWR